MNTQSMDWLTRKQAAAHLTMIGFPITAKTLSNMSFKGKGPPFRKVRERLTVYNRRQLEAWAILNAEAVNPAQQARKGGVLSTPSR